KNYSWIAVPRYYRMSDSNLYRLKVQVHLTTDEVKKDMFELAAEILSNTIFSNRESIKDIIVNQKMEYEM
ncbi:hypothetical protein, partial [Vallitalea sediminicola]